MSPQFEEHYKEAQNKEENEDAMSTIIDVDDNVESCTKSASEQPKHDEGRLLGTTEISQTIATKHFVLEKPRQDILKAIYYEKCVLAQNFPAVTFFDVGRTAKSNHFACWHRGFHL